MLLLLVQTRTAARNLRYSEAIGSASGVLHRQTADKWVDGAAAVVSTLLLLLVVVVVRLVVEGGEAPEDEADAQSMGANKSC